MKILTAAIGLALVLTGIGGCEKAKDSADAAAQKAKIVMEKAGARVDKTVQETEEKADAAKASIDGATTSEDTANAAVAVLHATAGNNIKGSVRFTPQGRDLKVEAVATGLTPGEHAYHIHIFGDCSLADGSSAGTHFNLQGSSLNLPPDVDRITGNLGALFADQNGNAQANSVLKGASLTGPKSIIGRAVIVHAEANDPEHPPIGAAGARQACGVIGIAQAAERP